VASRLANHDLVVASIRLRDKDCSWTSSRLPNCDRHACICRARVQPNGHHGLACRRSAERLSRHHLVNNLIARSLRSAGVPAIPEPPGLFCSDGKRPDGATLIPWSYGRFLVWDFTCPDTPAPSHLVNTSRVAGAAASMAEDAGHAFCRCAMTCAFEFA